MWAKKASHLRSQAEQVAQPKFDNSSHAFLKFQVLRPLKGHDIWDLHDNQVVALQDSFDALMADN